MPYLRFSRDGRGYENTYVLHTVREGGRVRPLMLYWSRTPPNVSVGRPPLDEDAIRLLEANNPGVVFEWKAILAARAAARADHGQSRPLSRGLRSKGGRAPAKAGKGGRKARTVPTSEGAAGGRRRRDAQGVVPASGDAESGRAVPAPREEDPVQAGDEFPPQGRGSLAAAGGGGRESTQNPAEHPVVTLMGEEALTGFRNRYAALQGRINREVSEVAERESIRARSEALNPDRWVGLEAALKGIERFEADAAEVERRLDLFPPPSGHPPA